MQQAGPERIISVNFSFLTKPALLKYNLCIIHVTHYKDTIDFSFSEFIHLCTNSAIRFLNTSMDLKSCLCLFTPYSHLWPQQLPVYIVSIILHLTEISSKRNHPLWGLCIWLLHLVKASEIHTGCSVGQKFALFFFFFFLSSLLPGRFSQSLDLLSTLRNRMFSHWYGWSLPRSRNSKPGQFLPSPCCQLSKPAHPFDCASWQRIWEDGFLSVGSILSWCSQISTKDI